MFSPYYAKARRDGDAQPLDHCALNVCLYLPRRKLWAMTERTSAVMHRSETAFALGNSAMEWDGDALTVQIEETANPLPFPIRGTVRLRPGALTGSGFMLDAQARHRWWPIAPFATVEVDLRKPRLSWRGEGYFDMNHGAEPLEDGFRRWNWSRAPLHRGAAVLYDVIGGDGQPMSLALRFDRKGEAEPLPLPRDAALPRTIWLMRRETRADEGERAKVLRTLEDTPFYARSVIASKLFGEPVTAMHETLSLNRFRTAWVQTLLPYRMPRRDQ